MSLPSIGPGTRLECLEVGRGSGSHGDWGRSLKSLGGENKLSLPFSRQRFGRCFTSQLKQRETAIGSSEPDERTNHNL
jgi:hypothetical protein